MSQELPPERMILQVSDDVEEKIRLDRFLTDQLPDFSRSKLQGLIREGKVTLNGELSSAKTPVSKGDSIEVNLSATAKAEIQAEDLPLDVLFEDEVLIVINKEEGICVHPGAGQSGPTLVHALLHHCQGKLALRGGEERQGIVHRLDKDTSGCLVAAKTDEAHERLQAAFASREVQKEYLCVVQGVPKQESGTIRNYLGRNPRNRKKMAPVPQEQGKLAHTDWEVICRREQDATLCCRIHTGRTHQIRVHMAYELGHPILGDPIYGRRTLNRNDVSRLMLHAWKLCFDHPLNGKTMSLEAPIPPCFAAFRQP